MKPSIAGLFLSAAVTVGSISIAAAQEPAPSPITRRELLKQVLPEGNFRDVQAAVIDLAPGASAARHRHDVAVMAYVIEGTVENRFDGGATQVHRAGESWWEPPGTIHDAARNASPTERARLLIVYIGEPGKAATVPLR
jgi:quercetin dioxygenase-like cupin family protein